MCCQRKILIDLSEILHYLIDQSSHYLQTRSLVAGVSPGILPETSASASLTAHGTAYMRTSLIVVLLLGALLVGCDNGADQDAVTDTGRAGSQDCQSDLTKVDECQLK